MKKALRKKREHKILCLSSKMSYIVRFLSVEKKSLLTIRQKIVNRHHKFNTGTAKITCILQKVLETSTKTQQKLLEKYKEMRERL